MRIAFTGKGGSGKTTLCSLFAAHMAHSGHNVLALDADINQHLASALQLEDSLPAMGEHIEDIKRHLAGANARIQPGTMQKTTPPGAGSNLVRIADNDWFISHYTRRATSGVRIGGAGEIPPENIGVKCYHGLNGAIELVLGHLLDTNEDIVLVDMTAGADAFSSSLFTKVDALVLVVEPTLKSLSVYEQFRPHASEYDIPLFVVANKVEDAADLAFIQDRVDSARLVAVCGTSTFVRKRERGEALAIDQLDELTKHELETLYAALQQRVPRDWQQLHQRTVMMHEKVAASWGGPELRRQIDPTFSLVDHV
jgi:CO dehydrogenase maturation factor